MSILSDPIFHDEKAAYRYVESILWPNGPVCPKCGAVDNAYALKGKRARPGLRRCKECKKDFTVKVGTVFEASHVSMCHWLQATYLMCASKKGFSAHQLHRTLGVTYKTAWFMFHRLREAMRSGDLAAFGADGGTVEVDETFIGHDRTVKPKHSKKGRGYAHKHKVLALVDRDTGRAKSMVVDDLKAKTLVPILKANIAKEATVYTDEAGQYRHLTTVTSPTMPLCVTGKASGDAAQSTPICQRRLKIRPKGGAKDCHLGWWSDLGVRLGVGDAVRGFFGGSGQRSHAELKRSAPAGRPQGGMVYRIGVSLATRALGARCRPGPSDGVPQFSYRHCFCGRGFG